MKLTNCFKINLLIRLDLADPVLLWVLSKKQTKDVEVIALRCMHKKIILLWFHQFAVHCWMKQTFDFHLLTKKEKWNKPNYRIRKACYQNRQTIGTNSRRFVCWLVISFFKDFFIWKLISLQLKLSYDHKSCQNPSQHDAQFEKFTSKQQKMKRKRWEKLKLVRIDVSLMFFV